AVLVLGVVDRPLSRRAFPDARVELAAGAAVVVAHALLGVALEDLLGGGTVVLGRGGGRGEVDDLLDVHGASCCCKTRVSGSLCLIKRTLQAGVRPSVKNIEKVGRSGLVLPARWPAIGLAE